MSISKDEFKTFNSKKTHNYNCFNYLLQLKNHITGSDELKKILQDFYADFNETWKVLKEIHDLSDKYDEEFAYGNLYTKFMSSLEDHIDIIYEHLNEHEKPAFDEFILQIYHNDNRNIENLDWLINDTAKKTSIKSSISDKIKKQLHQTSTTVNDTNPIKENGLGRGVDYLVSKNYKPQHGTNIPSLKHYSHKSDGEPQEYRFGTQAQRHDDNYRISPLFIKWLEIKASTEPRKTDINYVYFNKLNHHVLGPGPRAIESKFSAELHQLENNPSLKVAVISLPASHGLMDEDDYELITPRFKQHSVFETLFNHAFQKSYDKKGEIYISDNIAKKLFTDEETKRKLIHTLLENSFQKLGFTDKEQLLSGSQRQAVWMHFIKFEFTNYILDTLKPNSYNFTCKDAIDRGALASAYYNLVKSFELDKPIKQEEFQLAIDAAAVIVKGRGMNFHRSLLWNAVNSYVDGQYASLIADEDKAWLIHWRNMNCPKERINDVLVNARSQFTIQVNALSDNTYKEIKEKIHEMIMVMNTLFDTMVIDKIVLLEVISRTSEIIITPSQDKIEPYLELAKDIRINHENLYKIAGFMEIIAGILLLIPSLGFSLLLIGYGASVASIGFFAPERNKLADKIGELSEIQALKVD